MPEIGDPTLDQLRVLAAIADAGSFSAAARALNRAQSVISYTVANLESQLGVPLFDRSGRAPALTEAGRALMADARRIGAAVDDMRARAGALRHGTEAELAIAVDVMFPIARLVEVLRGFAAAFPTVSLRLRIEALGSVIDLVTGGACSIGISGWPGAMPDAVHRRVIDRILLVPVAAPDHPLASLGRIGIEDLRDHTQLVLSDASHLTDGQDFGVLSLHTWRLGDLGARHALLRAGLGWANMPHHLVAPDLAEGRLKILPIEAAPVFDMPVSLLHRRDTIMGPAATWLAAAFDTSDGGAAREAGLGAEATPGLRPKPLQGGQAGG
jgi:DNA-binding transcriptional LysR family regulator